MNFKATDFQPDPTAEVHGTEGSETPLELRKDQRIDEPEDGSAESKASDPAPKTSAPEPSAPETEARGPETDVPDPDPETADPETEARSTETARQDGTTIEGTVATHTKSGSKPPQKKSGEGQGGGGGGNGGKGFHRRMGPVDFSGNLKKGLAAVRRNMMIVMLFTCMTNLLILAIPIYLFQISDRVLTSRSIDTLVMLTAVIVGAVVLQAVFDALRRFVLMRTAVELAAKLGSSILSAAARAALTSNGREYQTLGDLQQLRGFLVVVSRSW